MDQMRTLDLKIQFSSALSLGMKQNSINMIDLIFAMHGGFNLHL